MASTFALLTAGGAKFDQRRFQKDIQLFAGVPGSSSKKGKERAVKPSSLPLSLTLSSHDPSSARDKKRRRRDPHADDRSDSGASASSAASSTQARPAPPRQKITLTGPDPLPRSLHTNLPSLTTHSAHPLPSSAGAPLLAALRDANVCSLWGVQCAVAGCLLDGKDTVCVAPTGSGKTLAYLLPTIVQLGSPSRSLRNTGDGSGVRAVVLVPTHDLAIQIGGVLKAVTRGRSWRCLVLTKATGRAVCESSPGPAFAAYRTAQTKEDESDNGEGTAEKGEESDGDDHDNSSSSSDAGMDRGQDTPLGVDVLIATPERLHHLVDSGLLSLISTRHIVLDESDRLLSSDFLPQVEPILKACSHPTVQKCFLSATMPAGAEGAAKKWLKKGGVRMVVGIKDSAVTTVAQSLLYTGSESGKLTALRNMISSGELPYPSLIFVQSVARAEELYQALVLEGVRADVVHGNKGKAKRDEAVRAFREGSVWMLVVTEVLARGMDFRGVKVVINYDFPQTVQSYIHRIGRTGRAGRPGRAITFFSHEDGPHLRTIANVLRSSGCPVPEYMLALKKPSRDMKKNLRQRPVKRKKVGGGGRDIGLEDRTRRKEMIGASRRKEGENVVGTLA